jgi:hypothetical protein
MTPKSPLEQAAELYPMPNDPLGVPYYTRKIILGQRQAWLSRQAEIDRLTTANVCAEEYIKLLEQQVIDLKDELDKAKVVKWIPVTPFTTTEEVIRNVVFQLKNGELRLGSFLPLDQWDRPNMFVDGAFHNTSSVVRYLPITPPKTD